MNKEQKFSSLMPTAENIELAREIVNKIDIGDLIDKVKLDAITVLSNTSELYLYKKKSNHVFNFEK